MKELVENNIEKETKEAFRRIFLGSYALGIGFKSNRNRKTKVLTFFIEKRYYEDGEKYIKRTGYGLQHTMYGVNNRISVHKRAQVLKQI